MLRGGGDFASVEQGVLSGPDQLWIAHEGASILASAITSLGIINDEKVCTIVACAGGGWKQFGHFIDDLEKFAKDEGCTSVRINGRSGWGRVLRGYDVRSVVLRKEL